MRYRDEIVIEKIISEMNMGVQLLGNTSMKDFLENELLKRALGMTAINVGELVKVVTEEYRIAHKDFPWKAVAGMRDITAHRYQTLRMEDVYNTVKMEYPELKEQLEKFLREDQKNQEDPQNPKSQQESVSE